MTHLHELTLTSPGIGSLVDLQHLTGLKALHLDDTSIGDDDLAIVARFKGLEVLTLANNRVGDAGWLISRPSENSLWLDLAAPGSRMSACLPCRVSPDASTLT